MRQLFKGDNYSREETIRGNTVCKLIINSVDEKNPKNVNCTTPLHEAVYNCHLNICKLIISTAVAQKNPANYQGITPLHIASLNGHCEMCKLIIF